MKLCLISDRRYTNGDILLGSFPEAYFKKTNMIALHRKTTMITFSPSKHLNTSLLPTDTIYQFFVSNALY